MTFPNICYIMWSQEWKLELTKISFRNDTDVWNSQYQNHLCRFRISFPLNFTLLSRKEFNYISVLPEKKFSYSLSLLGSTCMLERAYSGCLISILFQSTVISRRKLKIKTFHLKLCRRKKNIITSSISTCWVNEKRIIELLLTHDIFYLL